MLVDEYYNYIKANSGKERNICIEVNLSKENYYLITDINFRFVKKRQHCYNLSAYVSSVIVISSETGKNIEEAFKYGIYSQYIHIVNLIYLLKVIMVVIYINIKKSESEFLFMFCLFDNTNGKYDITLTDTPSYKSNI